jgi:hypothetical membrane protein
VAGGAAGVVAIALYVILAVASYALYPAAFNPRDNWLSDLGNAALNPSGSLLYRADAVVVGILVALSLSASRPSPAWRGRKYVSFSFWRKASAG